MAVKHMVKCMVCGESFDANAEPYIKPNSTRYAHESCYKEKQEREEREKQERELLENYIINLFHIEFVYPPIRAQIKDYITKYNYTLSGIYKTLKYCYEIKKMNVSEANGRIGIVPYYYSEAQAHYLELFKKQTQNVKEIETLEITIPIPQRKIKKKHLFTFLDEEE